MRKTFFLILLFASPLFSKEPDQKLHEKCLYPTVMITGHNNCGTGTIIRCDKIKDKYVNVVITCSHIFHNGDYNVNVYDYKNMSEIEKIRVCPLIVYAIDPTRDLAIVFFVSEKANYTADLDLEDKLYIGEEVCTFGCGWKEPPRLSCGKITSLHGSITLGNGFDYFRHSTYTLHGDSGAGLYRDYKLIGIVSALRANSPTNVANEMSYAVRVRQFKLWSKKENEVFSFLYTKDAIPKVPIMELEFKKNTSEIIK